MDHSDLRSLDELLAVIADPNTCESAFHAALDALRQHQATEPPTFWIAAAAAAMHPPWHRRGALLAFFRRFAIGMSLRTLVSIPGIASFLTLDHLYDRATAAKLPFDRRHGASVVMYRPELPATDNTAVYIQFSHPITAARLAASAADGQARSDNTIVNVGITE